MSVQTFSRKKKKTEISQSPEKKNIIFESVRVNISVFIALKVYVWSFSWIV